MKETWGRPRFFRSRRVWVIPLWWVILALVMGFVVPRLDDLLDLRFASVSPASETALLSSIASGMMALTAIVVSLSFVFLQFGSSAYSPRIVVYFITDPIVLHAIGVFTGTFLFALIALLYIDRFQSGDVPLITAVLALAWLIGSILMFLALVQRVTALQISSVLALIGNRGRDVIGRLYPPLESLTAAQLRATSAHADAYRRDKLPAPSQIIKYHGGPRIVVEINVPSLVTLAQQHNALIVIEYAVGDVVSDGSTVVRVYETTRKAKNALTPAMVRNHIALGTEHTIEQDPKYALRLLVDIAIKALSPAINDPTTAVMALNQIDDLLRRIGTRQLDVGYARDKNQDLRVIYPTPTWSDFLSLAIDEIRYYGANSIQVMRRLGAMLDDLERIVPKERDPDVRLHAERVNASIRRSFTDAYDRLDAQQVDRQGLGLGRPPDEMLEGESG